MTDFRLLLEKIDCMLATDKMIMIGIAGIPGSGKSTLAQNLCDRLNEKNPQSSVVVGMDGFHYSKAQLREFFPCKVNGVNVSVEEAFQRRGAPFTFDGEAFVKLLVNIRNATTTTTSSSSASIIMVPSFDHSIGDPIQDAIEMIPGIE